MNSFIENRLNQLKLRKKYYQDDLYIRLNWTQQECLSLMQKIKENRYLGLGGGLQKTWETFRLIGKIDQISEAIELLESEDKW